MGIWLLRSASSRYFLFWVNPCAVWLTQFRMLQKGRTWRECVRHRRSEEEARQDLCEIGTCRQYSPSIIGTLHSVPSPSEHAPTPGDVFGARFKVYAGPSQGFSLKCCMVWGLLHGAISTLYSCTYFHSNLLAFSSVRLSVRPKLMWKELHSETELSREQRA